MLGLGNVGNIGNLIGSVLGLGITAIVLLTFAPTVAGDVDGIFMQGKNACVYGGERFTQVIDMGTYSNADEAWTGGTPEKLSQTSGETTCDLATGVTASTTSATDVTETKTYFTPKGTEFSLSSTVTETGAPGTPKTKTTKVLANSEWQAPSASVSSLAGGSLVLLLLGAMAILVPAGALGFLSYTGAEMVRSYIGGSPLAIAIGATVAVVVIGAILPEIFSPLDNLFSVMDGKRYIVYNEGIGKLAGVLSDFFAIALIGGIVALGAMLWKSSRSEGEMV